MNPRTLILGAVSCVLLFSVVSSADEAPLYGDGAPPACAFRDRPCMNGPKLSFALEAGASTWNEGGPFGYAEGLGKAASPGPSWGVRFGVELTRWIAVEGHYLGMSNLVNRDVTPSGTIHLISSAAIAEVRVTLPLPFVQPYLFTGPGIYSTGIAGSESSRNASPFYSSTEFGIPIGVGIAVPVSDCISFGGEMAYHRLFGEALADDDEIGGGDLTTFNAVLRFRIPD
jgi:hypothetical protein